MAVVKVEAQNPYMNAHQQQGRYELVVAPSQIPGHTPRHGRGAQRLPELLVPQVLEGHHTTPEGLLRRVLHVVPHEGRDDCEYPRLHGHGRHQARQEGKCVSSHPIFQALASNTHIMKSRSEVDLDAHLQKIIEDLDDGPPTDPRAGGW